MQLSSRAPLGSVPTTKTKPKKKPQNTHSTKNLETYFPPAASKEAKAQGLKKLMPHQIRLCLIHKAA